jgi:hypothetical protein
MRRFRTLAAGGTTMLTASMISLRITSKHCVVQVPGAGAVKSRKLALPITPPPQTSVPLTKSTQFGCLGSAGEK